MKPPCCLPRQLHHFALECLLLHILTNVWYCVYRFFQTIHFLAVLVSNMLVAVTKRLGTFSDLKSVSLSCNYPLGKTGSPALLSHLETQTESGSVTFNRSSPRVTLLISIPGRKRGQTMLRRYDIFIKFSAQMQYKLLSPHSRVGNETHDYIQQQVQLGNRVPVQPVAPRQLPYYYGRSEQILQAIQQYSTHLMGQFIVSVVSEGILSFHHFRHKWQCS